MDVKRGKLSAASSSLFVTNAALISFAGLTVASSIWLSPALTALFAFLLLLCAASRIWGEQSMKRIRVSAECSAFRLFAGQTAEIAFRVENEKFLPLLWIEVALPFPRGRCIWPEGDQFEVFVPEDEDDEKERERGSEIRKKFSFLLWHQELEWKSVWTARRRGIYQPGRARVRSGDGFGLCQAEKIYQMDGLLPVAVYPAVRPVDPAPFLQVSWEAKYGDRGFLEDTGLVKGLRNYRQDDSYKKINWRALARGQELSVNLFETILPKAVHFILDGESFLGREDGGTALEETLSVLGSLSLRLGEARVRCGLSLPASLHMPAVNLAASEQTGPEEFLYRLASYEPKAELDKEEYERTSKFRLLPSKFDEAGILNLACEGARMFLVSFDTASVAALRLLEKLDASAVTLMPFCEPCAAEEARFSGYRILPVRRIERGNGG